MGLTEVSWYGFGRLFSCTGSRSCIIMRCIGRYVAKIVNGGIRHDRRNGKDAVDEEHEKLA